MVRLNWIGGEHEFALNIGELRALQNNCNAGPEQIAMRLIGGEWLVDDIIEIIRLGLIGGGMESKTAGPMVTGLIDRHPLMMLKADALKVLTDALMADEDDSLGETAGEASP